MQLLLLLPLPRLWWRGGPDGMPDLQRVAKRA